MSDPLREPRAKGFPAARGGALALLAALLFGASTPFVRQWSAGLGTFATAALLYAGAAAVGALLRKPVDREARLTRADVPRLLSMAFFGAVLGPVALVWGLSATGATSASLMLSLEAVFTAGFAWVWYREVFDRRVLVALLLLTAGGMALVFDRADAGATAVLGLLSVTLATAAWGVDNALSRGLATRDPGQVVMFKSALGAAATATLAVVSGEARPATAAALAILAIGAVGYGLSLRFYLLAQRTFGAARTASVFASAPFIGAAVAYVSGERGGGVWLAMGAALMVAGVILHLTERHVHEHRHEPLEHEHAHTHDDGHHAHGHMMMPRGTHSHAHAHTALLHSHAHVPDDHHAHRH